MIYNKRTFTLGLIMMLSFLGIFVFIMSPSFGNNKTGLQYADDMFNSLSKGSAYFIEEEFKKAEKMVGRNIDVSIKASDSAEAKMWGTLYSTAGASVLIDDVKVSIQGDLGKIMKETLNDSDAAYNNNGEKLNNKYGFGAREAMYAWYNSYNKIDKELKKQQKFKESSAINSLIKKSIEPAYNYYNVDIKHVKDYVLTVASMLVIYLVYTLWYGFAIYYLCDGLGLTMKKAAQKSEA
ncbi:MAG: hypothetical protein K6T65_02115 [Peptococcaceae bacterium]|nr:hypothetical protein [Peptococcaceae bacterium]